MAHTPYHIILSTSIASVIKEDAENDLMIFNDFKDSSKIMDTLRAWRYNPFKDIFLMHGSYQVESYTPKILSLLKEDSSHRITKKNIKFIKKYFHNNKVNKVFNFHDARLEGQLALYLNKKNKGTNICVEDGCAVYYNHFFHQHSFIDELYYRFFYFPYYQFIRFIGDNTYNDKLMALRPNLVRTELQDKNIEKIPKNALISLKEKGLTTLILESYNFFLESKVGAIIILPHSELFNKHNLLGKYNKIMTDIIEILKENGINFYVKYHPREKNYYLTQLHMVGKMIPQGISIEIVFLHLMDNQSQFVIGVNSSSLLTAKLHYNKSKIISIMKLLYISSCGLDKSFEKAKILLPNTLNELKVLLMEK